MLKCKDCNKDIVDGGNSGKCRSCVRKGKPSWNKGLKGFMKGRKVSLLTRQRQSISQLGNKNHNWKGGITSPSQIKEFKYEIWKDKVIERDLSTCVICNKFCMYPIAHHIKHAHTNPELKYSVDNGRTLCYDCHMIIHNRISYYKLKQGELSETLIETTLSQVWKETSEKVQRILAETKELVNSMSVKLTRAPWAKAKIYAELTGDCKK
jgi:hypothetical protein